MAPLSKPIGWTAFRILLANLTGPWGIASLKAAEPSGAPAGLELINQRNCTACHTASAAQSAWLTPAAAPRLENVGHHANAAWLQRFLASPETVKPGTSMPNLLRGDIGKAEALTHYLLSKGPPGPQPAFPDKAAAARGESLYHRIGCVACHDPQNGSAPPAGSVPLPRMEEKWAFDGLRKFLMDPLATRPSGRMPSLNLTSAEAADLAHYLLRGTKVPAAVEASFYSARLRALEDLDRTETTRTTPAPGLTAGAPLLGGGPAVRLTTWLNVETAGRYRFFLTASSASRFAINGNWVMGENTWESSQVAENHLVDLKAGWHGLKVDFVKRGNKEPSLTVEWEGPGIPRSPVPANLLSSEEEPVVLRPDFKPDPAKAEQGRAIYIAMNCAACHEAKPAAPAPPVLAALTSGKGCLAETPPAPLPHYHFDGAQRAALGEVLRTLNAAALAPPTPQQNLSLTLANFRCTQCHVRDGQGGVPADLDGFFTSNTDDVGDEGRLPPKLDGTGDKLRPEWIRRVLTEGAAVRPYLNTRMPQFGAAHTAHLADLLVSLDRKADPVPPSPDAPGIQRDAGRKITGTDGLSCIGCHQFNRQPAHALQVLDLTTSTQRLNEDWFRRFLRAPNRFNPGTRMPALWPGGHSLLPALLEGDTDRQHAALWTYLADGPQAKFPEGLSRQNMELVVGGEAVVYRGKLWEAGFRGIATGYPGQLNAAFDAEELRLALVWKGRFLNVSPHWSSQGMGRIRPLGDDPVLFPHGPAFAILTNQTDPWPAVTTGTAGMKFHGYQLDTLKQPVFLYTIAGTDIEDTLTPLTGPVVQGFHRTIKFNSPTPAGLHLRAAAGTLTKPGEGQWRLNGTLTLRLPAVPTAFVRGKGEQQELIVPAPPAGTTPTLEIDYAW
ncbi:MAG: c-type cytochrome [Verrucomicrobiota bacterium]